MKLLSRYSAHACVRNSTVPASSFQYLKKSLPSIVLSCSLVEPVRPFDFHVSSFARSTESTHAVNCAIRAFSVIPSMPDFIASLGVVGTLKILPPPVLRYTKLPSTGLNSM